MSWIDDYDKANPYRTIEERISLNQHSLAWEDADKPEITTFICDTGDERGFPFSKVESIEFVPVKGECHINWKCGTIILKGPKAKEFKDQFSRHEVGALKAVEPDITSVTYKPAKKKEQEQD